MRVEELVGRRVREIREDLGMSQGQLGEEIGKLLSKPWSRQTVSMAELGRRAFTAAELIALAHVLGVHVGQMFTPPVDLPHAELELSSGVTLDSQELMQALSEDKDDEEARRQLLSLIRSVQIMGNLTGSIQANVQFLLNNLTGSKPES